MSAPVKSIASQINWSALSAKLKPDTVLALTNFHRRHQELSKQILELKEQKTSIDFAHYKSILSNKAIVDEAEKALSSFKPASYDLTEQIRIIEEQEVKAVAAAEKTAKKINVEMTELNDLLKNIETARPIEQVTVEDVALAIPELDATVQKMIKRGQWTVPGYYERFGEFKVGF
ncbi:ATP synthase d subunit [Nowakowskiella sp. JEL0407]|nr:ATP synthase d subunit [Nowakowskiella sp. JEL0407]